MLRRAKTIILTFTVTLATLLVAGSIAQAQTIVWDTVSTGVLRLAVSNHGSMGLNGIGGANMDFSAFGWDCDPTADVYLNSGGPFIIQNNAGEYRISMGMRLTDSPSDPLAFLPVTSMALPSHETNEAWDMSFSGTFVNWDSTIALEAATYAPVGEGTNPGFVIREVRLFSADGNGHNNLAIGNTIDWNIPSDSGADNNAYISSAANTIVFRGTEDPANTEDCQDNTSRFGATGFLGWYTNSEYNSDNCSNTEDFVGLYGARNDSDKFIIDDTLYAEFLWNKTSYMTGQNGLAENADLHAIMTYVHSVNMQATDTFTFFTAISTVGNGTVDKLADNLVDACEWYDMNLRDNCGVCGCCIGLTGNVNGDPDDICDIGDLTALITYMWPGPWWWPTCLEEANCDGVGGVDIGDLTKLIDYLFISFAPPAPC